MENEGKKVNIVYMELILTSESQPSDELVPADGVEVHDGDVQRAVTDLLPRNVKLEGCIENRVQVTLVDWCLLFLHAFVAKHQPNFDVGI